MYVYHAFVDGMMILTASTDDFLRIPERYNISPCSKTVKEICSVCPVDFWGILATVFTVLEIILISIKFRSFLHEECKTHRCSYNIHQKERSEFLQTIPQSVV
jgi:hypothetical protein